MNHLLHVPAAYEETMKLNGYRIKNAIQSHCHQREVLGNQFKKSLKKFPDEDKPKPTAIMQHYRTCEETIAHLQQLQTVYNNTVKVNFEGGTVPLAFLIKAVGGMGRTEKMWRTATPKPNRYYDEPDERKNDTTYAVDQMTAEELLEYSRAAARRSANAREQIALGNATEIEMDVDSRLFE